MTGAISATRLAQAAEQTQERRYANEPKFQLKFGASGFNERNLYIQKSGQLFFARDLEDRTDGAIRVHFAVIFLVGAAIGFITPPFGLNLYVASGITDISYVRLLPYAAIYFLVLLLAWLVIALWSPLAMYLVGFSGLT